MEEFNRRNFLKASGAAAATAVLGITGSKILSEDDFTDVVEAVNERTQHIDEHPGQKIHYDDPNKLLEERPVGFVGPYYLVEEKLENNTVEEIGRTLPGKTDINENNNWYDFIQNQELNMRIVHLDQDNYDVDMTEYVDRTKYAFEDLLSTEYKVNVVGEIVEPDEEDKSFLQNSGEGFTDLQLGNKYSDEGERPVFLTSQNLKDGSSGYANLMENTSFVELNSSEESNIATTIHELGHLTLFLPHNYRETGVMSYNSKAGNDLEFNSDTKLLVDAIMEGEINYSKSMIEVVDLTEPEEEEYEAPVVDVAYEPSNIDSAAAEDYVKANIDAFVNQYVDATADEVVIGEDETSVIYSSSEEDLEILLDEDVKDARLI